MTKIALPFDRGQIEVEIDERNLAAVLAPVSAKGESRGEREICLSALQNPIGTPRLRELSRGKRRVTLVTSDHTRAMPSRVTLPLLLAEIREGNPEAEITILIATGLHRATTEEEQRRMFGDEIVDRERIAVNDAFRPEDFVRVCTLPSGAQLNVNRLACECDLLVTEGFIEPHFFAGFSGGRKSILPGICSEETVNENHSYGAISSPFAAAGVLKGNPIHEDMVFAARAVGVGFIFNVALDEDKKISAAFAGDLELAHEKGVEYVSARSRCDAVEGDIVITGNGGYPLDQNLYQSPKAVATAEQCAGEDGVIIMCAACSDGIGGKNFERIATMGSPEEIDAYLSAIPAKKTIAEQWCAQIYARVLKKHRVILVSKLNPQTVKSANLIPASSAGEALELAYKIKGRDARVVVIPDGVSVTAVKPAILG